MAPPYTKQQREQIERALVRGAHVFIGYALIRVRKGAPPPNERTKKGRDLAAEAQRDRALEMVQEITLRVLDRDRVFEWEGEIDQDRFQGFFCFAIKSLDDRRPDQKRPHHEFDDETDAPATSKTSEDLLARKRAIERLQ